MRFDEFERLVRRQAAEIPREYLDGVLEIVVSHRTVSHPERSGIFTLGEAIPLPAVDDRPDAHQTRIVLYHGSFEALAEADPEFDWSLEAWDTLTHELGHHLEWRAGAPGLEALDEAAESNYARQDSEGFDPWFYRGGELLGGATYRVEDDYFIEVSGRLGREVEFEWSDRRYRFPVDGAARPPVYFHVEGVVDPPPGDLVVVSPGRPRLGRTSSIVTEVEVEATLIENRTDRTGRS